MFPKLVNIHGYTNVLMIPMFPNWSTSMVKKITVPNIVILSQLVLMVYDRWSWFPNGFHDFQTSSQCPQTGSHSGSHGLQTGSHVS